MLPQQVIYYGKDEALPERVELRAGPLHLYYEDGDLRYIRYGDREILRRIYVAIRDRNWGTTPPVFFNVQMDIGAERFQVDYDVRNHQGEIDFLWHGKIIGEPDGTIRFSMDGTAQATFMRNRIGFCVLYPAFLQGEGCLVEHTGGKREPARMPVLISSDQPVQPFAHLQAMAHEVIPGVWADVHFTGEVFEMEDQRNWTDASYKIFCTPLSLPYPVEVAEGTRLFQEITLTIRDERARQVTAGSEVKGPQPLKVSVGKPSEARKLPTIGLGCASHGQPLSQKEIQRLGALNLGHLRVDLRLSESEYPATLRRVASEARALNVPLEVALHISADGEAELQGLCSLLEELGPEVRRWLVYPGRELFAGGSPTAQVVSLAHTYLDDYQEGVEFCAGTNTDFIFMKRTPPPLDSLEAVTFAIISEVHAFDNASIVETLEAQAMVLESARHLAEGKPVIVSPVTFKMRFNPYATGPAPVVKPGELPPQVEVRQMSLFGAAWTLGSIKQLAESGGYSLTYYETSGWRGVMETQAGSPLPEIFHSLPGGVFPMYHVFASLGEFAGGEVIPCQTSDNLRVNGLALEKGDKHRVMIANMIAEQQVVQVEGLGTEVTVRCLDENNALEAMQNPESFRALPGERRRTERGALQLQIWPYGIVTVDS